MKTKVLLYRMSEKSEVLVFQTLNAAGICVHQAHNLTKLHLLIVSRHYDAILVHQRFLDQYKFMPVSHFWQHKAHHSLVTFEETQDGTLKCELHRRKDDCDALAPGSDPLPLLIGLLESARERTEPTEGSGEVQENEPAYSFTFPNTAIVALPTDIELLLHRKLRLILKSIADSGQTGVNIEEITEYVWGTKQAQKKEDIQSYVSKLRALLHRSFANRYHIQLTGNRYRLVDTVS